MKLKIEIHEFTGGTVAMQILEQEGLPERWKEGKVQILAFPELTSTCIHLLGVDAGYDNRVVTTTDWTAEAIVKAITEAMKQWAVAAKPPEEGDEVMVWDVDRDNGLKRTYLYTTSHGRHFCVDGWGEDSYRRGGLYDAIGWKHMEPLKTSVKYTQEGSIHTWEEAEPAQEPTPKELRKRLLKEAEEQGFVAGARVRSLSSGVIYGIDSVNVWPNDPIQYPSTNMAEKIKGGKPFVWAKLGTHVTPIGMLEPV